MRYLKEYDGMTIVEVMTSMALISLVIGGFLGLLLANIKAGETMDYNYAAMNIAKSRMDRIRELRRDKGYDYLYTAAETDVSVNRDGAPDEDGEFTRSTSVTTNFEGKPNLTEV